METRHLAQADSTPRPVADFGDSVLEDLGAVDLRRHHQGWVELALWGQMG